LNRKQKKELRRHLSTRQLMGIDQLTEHGLKTAKGELVFFLLSPDNLSVLSSDGVRNRVRALTELLRGLDAAELLALDSRESFQSNKDYYQTRLEQEEVPAIREMLRRNMDHLDGSFHCAVFIELCARDADGLRALRDEVTATLTCSKLGADRLFLVQRNGFLAVNPAGSNVFVSQFERVLPASSVANLFPFNYSGKNDPNRFYIGKDRFGSNIILDLDRRAEDKTNANALILGNSGQGKSFLLKLLLCNILASGKSVICLDAEHELDDLCQHMGGCFADVMSGEYIFNPLEPKLWNAENERDDDAPAAFRQRTRLSQHISDFFRSYKDFTDRHIDTIELMLERLYKTWGLNDHTDFKSMRPEDFPILSDLYEVMENAYQHYEQEKDPLYPKELLQEVLLGLHSMCKGAESKFFNGHTNVTPHRFLVFGVKDLINGSLGVRNTMLFNLLSYLSDKLLTEGHTVAGLDELYIWLSNPTAVEYIRNTLKRVRKKESALLMASQNLEDFDVPGVREMTRPLFAIPTHQFLFNAGNVDRRFYMYNLQLETSEFELIAHPQNGVCLFKCGNERYLLEVHAPEHIRAPFGEAGGNRIYRAGFLQFAKTDCMGWVSVIESK